MNPRLDQLTAYPFERLARLKAGITPPAALTHIAMSIGEPRHAPPAFVVDALRGALGKLDSYPATAGLPETRAACAAWLERRFGLRGRVDPGSMVLPVNGTREALFSFVQAVVSTAGASRPAVAMPNPFYQIYEGAALLAGAEPVFLNTTADARFQPDLDSLPASVWKRCQVLFLCSPGNPTGAVLSLDFLRQALELEPHRLSRVLELASFLSNRGRHEEADELFALAARISPEAPSYLFARGEALVLAKRDPDLARQLLGRYLNSDRAPDDPPPSQVRELLKKL